MLLVAVLDAANGGLEDWLQLFKQSIEWGKANLNVECKRCECKLLKSEAIEA